MNTIYIIGDSTVDDNQPPFRGWGWALPRYIREGVTVKNHALSGHSSRSFRAEGLFEPVERAMGPGDLLLIQFGHNDEKDDEPPEELASRRPEGLASRRPEGLASRRHTDPDTTFPEELWRYCAAALSRGAQPVLITPVCRRFFGGDGSLFYTHGEYPRAIRKLAAGKGIPLCDLKAASRALYRTLGEQKTAELFVRLAPGENPDFPEGHDDRSHFNAHGATVIAGLVAEGLRQLPECAGFIKQADNF